MKSKKSLGQNFLKSRAVAGDFVRAVKIKDDDTVVEIGPGKGMITGLLLEKTTKVIAIEKDEKLVSFLQKKFALEIKSKKLIIVHDDILLFNPVNYSLVTNGYILVGAIPYYITGKLLRMFLQETTQPNRIAFIVQKEVAERIAVKNGKESVLSITVKAYGTPCYIKTIKARNFSPQPKIDSAILVIENISKKFFDSIQTPNIWKSDFRNIESGFFEFIKLCFSSKRKKLSTNLKEYFKKNTSIKSSILQDVGIPQNARAEDLSLAQFEKLYKKIKMVKYFSN